MKLMKKVLALAAAALLLIQFVRPAKNHLTSPPAGRIESSCTIPADVMAILRRSCYDCHSDSTVYPWYAEIQPVGWWLDSHIRDGKRQLDFDRFGTYRPFRQFGRFRQIGEQLERNEMPLGSYLLIHRYARLSDEEKTRVVRWSAASMDSMKARWPADSLERPRGGRRQF